MGVPEVVTAFLLAFAGGLVALAGVKILDSCTGMSQAYRELLATRLDVYSELSDHVQQLIIAGFTCAHTTGEEKQAAITRYHDALKTLTESWARFQLVFGEKVGASAQNVFYAIVDTDPQQDKEQLADQCEKLLEKHGQLLRSMRQDLHSGRTDAEITASFETSMRERLRQALRQRELHVSHDQPPASGTQP